MLAVKAVLARGERTDPAAESSVVETWHVPCDKSPFIA